MTSQTKTRISVTLDKEVVKKLQELRATCAINISAFINHAIIKHLQGGAK